MNAAPQTRETWGGRTAFIIAAVSSAIGLGNIWRFPGVAYENGGGAFLIPYIVAIFTAGLPILFLDYAMGHRYQASAPLTFRRIRKGFEPLGWWQVGICFVIAAYYAVVVAWAIAYAFYAVTQAWGDDAVGFFLNNHLRISDEPGFTFDFAPAALIPLLLIWALAITALALGIRRGLDRANKFTLPLLALTFFSIVVYSLFLPGAVDGLNAFFTPNWGELANPQVWIAAYGHVFFSFSVAFGIMLTYSSYMGRKSDLTGSGLVVAFANSSFEIIAGVGVFATLGFLAAAESTTIGELENIQGVGLAFMTYPTLLSEMPGGIFVGILFFISLVLAGFSSLLSILQVIAAAIKDKTGWSTRKAGVVSGIAMAIPSVLLFATTSGLHALDVIDSFINNIGVVGSAVMTLVLVIMVARKGTALAAHINAVSSFKVGSWWLVMLSTITPLVLLAILVTGAWGYISQGYGTTPSWFVTVAGWGTLLLLFIASFALSYRPYATENADQAPPEDLARLTAEVERDRATVLADRERKELSK